MSYHTAAQALPSADTSYLTNFLISMALAFGACVAVWRMIHPARPAFALAPAWHEIQRNPLANWAWRAAPVGRHRRPGWWAGKL